MTPKTHYTASEARERFADVFDAAHHGFLVTISKRERQVAVVPMSVLERYLALQPPAEQEELADAR